VRQVRGKQVFSNVRNRHKRVLYALTVASLTLVIWAAPFTNYAKRVTFSPRPVYRNCGSSKVLALLFLVNWFCASVYHYEAAARHLSLSVVIYYGKSLGFSVGVWEKICSLVHVSSSTDLKWLSCAFSSSTGNYEIDLVTDQLFVSR